MLESKLCSFPAISLLFRSGGRPTGLNENKANSARQLELELGLGWAWQNYVNGGHYVLPETPKGSARTSLGPIITLCRFYSHRFKFPMKITKCPLTRKCLQTLSVMVILHDKFCRKFQEKLSLKCFSYYNLIIFWVQFTNLINSYSFEKFTTEQAVLGLFKVPN